MPAWSKTFAARLALAWRLDSRSLALFRVAVGSLVLYDLARRWRDFSAHYTDAGILPLSTYRQGYGTPWDISPYLWHNSPAWAAALMSLTAVAAAALACGWRSKISGVVTWLLLMALHNRVPILEYGGDTLLRLLLFWCLFVELDRHGRLGARVQQEAQQRSTWGSAALVIQVVAVYWMTVLLKTGPEWHDQGSAAFMILAADQFTTPLGRQVLELLQAHRDWIPRLTHAAYATEVLAPLLLILPSQRWQPRALGLTMLGGLHLGLLLFMDLGIFAWVDLVSLLPFIPAAFWQAIGGTAAAELPNHAEATGSSWWQGGVVAAALVLMLLWNLSTLPQAGFTLPTPLFAVSRMLRLDQNWRMFAPSPLPAGGWVISVGYPEGGARRQLFPHEAAQVDFTKPASVADSYHNDRWRLMLTEMATDFHGNYRSLFADFLCRKWQSEHRGSPALQQVALLAMREPTVVDLTRIKIEPQLLGTFPCRQEPATAIVISHH